MFGIGAALAALVTLAALLARQRSLRD